MSYTPIYDFDLLVARGKVPGHEIAGKDGYDPAATSTTGDVWTYGGILSWPTAAATASIVSTSAQDGVGGTGIRTITLEGLDASYNRQSETITTNGTGAVTSSLSYIRLYRMIMASVGSAGAAVGAIRMSISGVVQGEIQAGNNRSMTTHYTVPAGFTYYPDAVYITTGTGKEVRVELMYRAAALTAAGSGGFVTVRRWMVYEPSTSFPLEHSIVLPEKTDIAVRATITGAGATEVSFGYRGYLVSNTA